MSATAITLQPNRLSAIRIANLEVRITYVDGDLRLNLAGVSFSGMNAYQLLDDLHSVLTGQYGTIDTPTLVDGALLNPEEPIKAAFVSLAAGACPTLLITSRDYDLLRWAVNLGYDTQVDLAFSGVYEYVYQVRVYASAEDNDCGVQFIAGRDTDIAPMFDFAARQHGRSVADWLIREADYSDGRDLEDVYVDRAQCRARVKRVCEMHDSCGLDDDPSGISLSHLILGSTSAKLSVVLSRDDMCAIGEALKHLVAIVVPAIERIG